MKTKMRMNFILPGIIIICMAAFVSCSKGRNNPEPTPPDNKVQLALTVTKTNVVVNETVTFTVTADGQTIADAGIYIDDKPANSMTWRFSAGGTYIVSAKKEGFKESKPQTITVKEPVKITATQIITTPRSPALGKESKMCYGGGKIYTFDRANGKFMSYDIAAKTWANLAYGGQLEFAGYTGQMTFDVSRGRIYYFNGNNNIYRISANSWDPIIYIDNAFAAGEAAYVIGSSSTDVFSAGGRMYSKNSSSDVRKYAPNTNTWEKVADMPVALRRATAVLGAYDKMYIVGEKEDNTLAGVIFDTPQLTSKSWTLPGDMSGVRSNQCQLAIYNNYIFYNNGGAKNFHVYNIQSGKWIDAEVTISGDFLSGSVNLFVTGSDFYAAGEKDGNFALYKLTVSFSE